MRYKNNILTIYPHIPKIKYSVSNHLDLKLNIPKKISGVDKSELCWNTPFLCRIGTFDGLDIKRINNYLFIFKNKLFNTNKLLLMNIFITGIAGFRFTANFI